MRVLKLSRAGSTLAQLMDIFDVSPKHLHTATTATTFVLSIHILASVWWLSKVVPTLSPLYRC